MSATGMTYDQAVTMAKAGTPVIRAHWCWVQLGYSPRNDRLFLDHEDGERQGYRPTEEDKKATDWRVSPFRR